MFDVRDKDHAYTEAIGIVEIATQHLLNGQVIEGWFPITKGNKVGKFSECLSRKPISMINFATKKDDSLAGEISDSIISFLKNGSINNQV